MVHGALVFDILRVSSPETLRGVLSVLRQHPHYSTLWMPQLQDQTASQDEIDKRLLELAARWPDDIRNDDRYHRGEWHYINLPLVGPGQDAPDLSLEGENVLSAFVQNLKIYRESASVSEQAVALCWLLHLSGDLHQPLHVSTFVDQDRFAQGDRGGTRFYVRAEPEGRPVSLHALWDGLVIGSRRFRAVEQRAALLLLDPALADQGADGGVNDWIQESYRLAGKAYWFEGVLLEGRPESAAHRALPLPEGYLSAAQQIAEQRMVQAAYRLGRLLSTESPAGSVSTI